MDCEKARTLIVLCVGNELSREEQAALCRHLSDCASCREEMKEQRLIWEQLSALPIMAPPEEGKERLLQNLERLSFAPPLPSLRCDDVREKLWELLDGELNGREAAAVIVHLAGCDKCLQEWAAIESYEAVLGALPPVVPPAGAKAALLARLEAMHHRRIFKERWQQVWRTLFAPAALRPLAAAMLLAAAIVGGVLWRKPSSWQSPVTSRHQEVSPERSDIKQRTPFSAKMMKQAGLKPAVRPAATSAAFATQKQQKKIGIQKWVPVPTEPEEKSERVVVKHREPKVSVESPSTPTRPDARTPLPSPDSLAASPEGNRRVGQVPLASALSSGETPEAPSVPDVISAAASVGQIETPAIREEVPSASYRAERRAKALASASSLPPEQVLVASGTDVSWKEPLPSPHQQMRQALAGTAENNLETLSRLGFLPSPRKFSSRAVLEMLKEAEQSSAPSRTFNIKLWQLSLGF